MDAGVVQHVFAFRHPQKTGALDECLWPQLVDLFQLVPAGKGPVFLPVLDDVFRDCGAQAGDALQQGGGGGVQIHAYVVDAVLHHAAQGFIQPLFGHVVLILPHADGLGIDFYQLRQRVLKPAGDGDGAPQGQVELRKFLRRKLGGGIYRRAGLADHHIGAAFLVLLGKVRQHLRGEHFRFLRGGAVTDGDDLHLVFLNHPGYQGFGLLNPGLGVCGINDAGIQYPAGGVHHRYLAAGAVARVKAHRHLALDRRLHQKVSQIHAEYLNGGLLGVLRQGRAQLPFHRRKDQAGVGVLGGLRDRLIAGGRPFERHGIDDIHGLVLVQFKRNL